MLTPDQKNTFFNKGYLILPQFIADVASGFEDFVWDCLHQIHGIDRNEPQTWNVPCAWGGMKNFKEAEIFQKIGTEQLCEAIDDLLGPEKWKKPRHWGGFLVNFPDTAPKDWHVPNDGWHVDFHYTHPLDKLFGLRVFTFLSEVPPRGGGTLFVPGSHRLVAKFVNELSEKELQIKYAQLGKRFLRSNPWLERLTQENKHAPGRIEAFMNKPHIIDDIEISVEQFCGRPSDVILMHPWTLHVRSPHSGTLPRFMLAKSIYLST